MAISDTKKDVYLGQSVEEQVKNTDDNFVTLFDNDDDLQTQINTKEPEITKKNTAFNKNFATTVPLADSGNGSAGSATTVARGDHVHPTDTTRLSTTPDGTNTLLDDSNKIRSTYLPDTVLGQLYYQGIFDASTGRSLTPARGDYYICQIAGSKNPDATSASSSYAVGDWAVYNGTSWDKIDNTDAVTLVNGQSGSVKTYKGEYSSTTQYYQGDIVANNSCLYLYINANASTGNAPTSATYWKIFGKEYEAATQLEDGLMSSTDKRDLDLNTEARHKHSNKSVLDATTASYTTAEKTKLGQIDDSLLGVTADEIGKVKDVKVNGTSVLNTSTGVASITIEALNAGFVSVATTDSVWTTQTINGTTYQAIKVAKTDTALGVFNSIGQEIVVQKVYDTSYLYLCVGTSKIACTVRKIGGNSVGTSGGTSNLYRHCLSISCYENAINSEIFVVSLYNNYSTEMTDIDASNLLGLTGTCYDESDTAKVRTMTVISGSSDTIHAVGIQRDNNADTTISFVADFTKTSVSDIVIQM